MNVARQSISSHAGLRALVPDLFEPRSATYWVDFLFHVLVGWAAFVWALVPTLPTWQQALLLVISSLALYRSVIFTHELVHVRRGKLPGFRLLWDVLCGIPLLVPSFMYDGVHQEHHFRSHYGTPADGEYLPFGRPPRSLMIWYLLSHILIPLLLAVRFGLIGPLSWLIPRFRHYVWVHMSSLSIDPTYRRPVPEQNPNSWVIQETACTIFVWCILALTASGWIGSEVLIQWYGMAVAVLTLNGLRTLVAHRYRNNGGTLTFDQQLLDSVNLAGKSPLIPLLAPVGLRYHGLHHLFPTMPYHNLGTAHRRLLQRLPDDAPYRLTIEPGFWSAFMKLWRSAGR